MVRLPAFAATIEVKETFRGTSSPPLVPSSIHHMPLHRRRELGYLVRDLSLDAVEWALRKTGRESVLF